MHFIDQYKELYPDPKPEPVLEEKAKAPDLEPKKETAPVKPAAKPAK